MNRDNQRTLRSSQKQALLFGSNRICGICNEPIKPDEEIHFHHTIPHSHGGKTEIANSQVVHAKCNQMIGAKFSELSELKIKLRKWQERSLAKFLNKIEDSNEKFVKYTLDVVPAAGKTLSALSKLYVLKKRNLIDFAVILVPSVAIKTSWTRTGKNIFNLNILDSITNLGLSRWQGNSPSDCDALVLTYQQFASFPEAIQMLIANNKTLTIFDEVHHLSENLTWGLAASNCFENKSHIISMSGTFYRSDASKIFSVSYSDSGQILTDFQYTYIDGLRDKFLRKINFNFLDGEQKWKEDELEKTKNFQDTVSKTDEARVLLTSLTAPDNKFIDQMILLMEKKIKWKEQFQIPRVKGLCFCIDQAHARRVAKRINYLTGEKVLIAISDNITTAEQLANFNDSDTKYCCTVRKLGEGFSAPLINVICWMTNVREEAPFTQGIHRGTRYIQGLSDFHQTTEVILPSNPKLKSFAKTFDVAKERYLKEVADKKKGKTGGSISSSFLPLASDARFDSVIKIDLININAANQNRSTQISPEAQKLLTYSDEKNKLSNENNKLVNQIHRLTGEPHRKIHYRSFDAGLSRVATASIKDLKMKQVWLVNEIARLKD